MYLVRAVDSLGYMDHPLDHDGSLRQVESSDDSCSPHRIRWEASFHGKVTTEPIAGSLPIKDVKLPTSLVKRRTTKMEISFCTILCEGCSGETKIHGSGSFDNGFNLDNSPLHEKNEEKLPVHINFSMTSGSLPHNFTCNDG